MISLPNEFTSGEAEAVRIAARMAGLNVLRVVGESDCISIAHSIDVAANPVPAAQVDSGELHVFLFDLGAHGLNMAVFSTDDGERSFCFVEVQNDRNDRHCKRCYRCCHVLTFCVALDIVFD